MTTAARGLGDAIVAMVPDTLAPVYEIFAPLDARPPWQIVTVQLPDITARSLANPAHAHDVTLSVKCVAGTAAGARSMVDLVQDAVEDVRPVADGWVCGPFGQINMRFEQSGDDTQIPTGAVQPVVQAIVEYRCTACITTAPVGVV